MCSRQCVCHRLSKTMGREGNGAIAQTKTKRCVLLLALLSFSFCCVILDYLRLSLLVKHARRKLKVEYLIVFGADVSYWRLQHFGLSFLLLLCCLMYLDVGSCPSDRYCCSFPLNSIVVFYGCSYFPCCRRNICSILPRNPRSLKAKKRKSQEAKSRKSRSKQTGKQ